jgi:lactoylglutathione lyase
MIERPLVREHSMKVSYAIIFVSDMSRSMTFYRDVIGLPLRFESPQWTEFATEGATLALHLSSAPGGKRADPNAIPAGHCRPGLSVPDLDAFHARMVEKNVVCIEPPHDVHGSRLAQYLDPDGMGISVSGT